MFNVPQLIVDYSQLLPYFLLTFIATLLITPLVGKLAYRLGALDIPARLQGRDVKNFDKFINEKVTARLGGLAMFITLFAVFVFDSNFDVRWGIIAGLLVISVVGILDDIYDLPSSVQFISQFLAAILVVMSGITITYIQIAGVYIDLNLFSTTISIGDFVYYLIFPGDIIAILWIVSVTNFINWASGIDALNGSLSAIAGTTILLISMRTGNLPLALMSAAYVGSVLGVLPYNYPPSKIFYGFGEYINGFLLAILAILSGSKLAISIIILGLPILDAIWVIFTRINKKRSALLKPWTLLKVITTGDGRNHLHHRLLSLGFTWKMVLLFEVIIMVLLCIVAFYFSGFSNEFVAILGVVAGMLVIFLFIILSQRRMSRIKVERDSAEAVRPRIEVRVKDQNDKGEKFTY